MDYYHHFTPRISTHESEFENSAFEFVPSNPPPIKGNDVGDNVEGVQSVQDPLQAAPIQSPPAPPTISTFSASSRNQIHIVQTYVHSQSGTHNPFCTNPTLHTQFVHHNGQHNNFFGEDHLMGSGSGQPPRPANAWILYRSDKMRDLKPPPSGQPRPPQADISKLIAAMWKNEQPEIKQHYETLSDLKKAEHLALYPGYRFQPMKKADKDKARAEKRAEKERERAAAVAAKGIPRKPTRTTKRQSVEPGDESRMAEPAVESSSSSSQPTPITMPSLLNPSNIPIGSATLVPNFVTPPPGLTLPPGTQLVQWPALPAMRAHPNAYSPYQTKAKKKRTRAAAQEQQEPSTKPEPSLEPSLSSPTNFWTSESLDHVSLFSFSLCDQPVLLFLRTTMFQCLYRSNHGILPTALISSTHLLRYRNLMPLSRSPTTSSSSQTLTRAHYKRIRRFLSSSQMITTLNLSRIVLGWASLTLIAR